MLFDQCKLFRDIAQERSLTRAAEMNHITTSAASQHLREIETRLGLELIDRSRRPVSVTDAGKLYFDLCKEVLRREESFLNSIYELRGATGAGPVSIAAIYSIALWEMNSVEAAFYKTNPNCQLTIEYLRPDLVYEAVALDRVDFGIVSYPEAGRDLTVIPWREERMVAVVTPDHRFATRKSLTPADLEGETLIQFDRELPIRRDIDRYLRDCGVRVESGAHFDNIAMVKEAVAMGSGISLLPEVMIHEETDAGRLVALPLSEPELYRPVGIIHRKRRDVSPSARSLLNLLLEHSSTPATSGVPA